MRRSEGGARRNSGRPTRPAILREVPTPGDMGCLLFLLLWALLQAWGSAEVPQRLFPLRCLQISSFANSNWTRTDGLAWLGELQTHSWSNDSDTIRSLKPWSQGTFSDQQWEALQRVFRVYRSSFTRDVKEFAKMLRLACELRDPGPVPKGGEWPQKLNWETVAPPDDILCSVHPLLISFYLEMSQSLTLQSVPRSCLRRVTYSPFPEVWVPIITCTSISSLSSLPVFQTLL